MKIARIRIHAVAVPPTPTALYRIAADVPLDEQLRSEARIKWIAELETDDGLIGIGESHRGIAYHSRSRLRPPILPPVLFS